MRPGADQVVHPWMLGTGLRSQVAQPNDLGEPGRAGRKVRAEMLLSLARTSETKSAHQDEALADQVVIAEPSTPAVATPLIECAPSRAGPCIA